MLKKVEGKHVNDPCRAFDMDFVKLRELTAPKLDFILLANFL